MAYEVTVGTLTATQKTDAADLLQKLEALNGTLSDLQTDKAKFEDVINEKIRVIQKEKDTTIDALRALRSATVKETI